MSSATFARVCLTLLECPLQRKLLTEVQYSDEETPPALTEQEVAVLRLHHSQLGHKTGMLPAGPNGTAKAYQAPPRLWLSTGADTESTADSRGTSGTPTSESSASQTYFIDGPPTEEEANKPNHRIFTPKTPPEKKIIPPVNPLLPPVRPPKTRKPSNSTDEISVSQDGPSNSATAVAELPQEKVAIAQDDSVAPEVQAVAVPQEKLSAKDIVRGQRNIKLQKWTVTFALVGIK
jgi:hypothetical protein